MTNPEKIYHRAFINDKQGIAAIEYEITHKLSTDETSSWIFADFSMSDCNRTICLDFGVNSREDAQDKLNKLANIREALDKFTEAFTGRVREYLIFMGNNDNKQSNNIG